ncbi:polyketide synthase family protein [Frankia torreyi]|uniref:Phenolphthiocerol/phthiocerol polyketide synthase subunit E n=4 Tax=Frankia TaxID=1854 RepID=A0A0D8BFV7_9ACTN|nr:MULTISPECIES: type I polyketide synthase [Frankia]KJE23036.1 polyketide synthase family protein [Frankia torreyi]
MSDAAQDLEQVAIVGMAGRFPAAPDVDAFWTNLTQGRESIAVLSDEELLASGVDPALLELPNYVRAKGVLEDADLFDAGFFGFSPREAQLLDPQHRVFLECAWQAVESAVGDPRAFGGRIGVFAGASLNSYLLFNVMADPRAVESSAAYQTLLASDKDFLATRTSYKLDLRGPGITVQTACSTSLTAVHLACQSLLNGECDLALAGGVSVGVPLRGGYVYEPGGILSPDGHCRAFDEGAGGTVPGNGVGIVVLRRLSEAVENGDDVRAVIRGTAVNNDGSLKAGYTAPSVDGQTEVIAEALAVADVDPATIEYVETHGTGTALGDPIEIAALTRAFREHTQDTGFCAIGSVKSNVGHLDAAAGVTALIKATLALRNEAIPATLGCTAPSPGLELDKSPFFVNTRLRPWPRRATSPRRAGVSAFGIGGTNVHVVLEEAPGRAAAATEAHDPGQARAVRLLPISGRTPAALAANAGRLADHLAAHPDADLGDVAFTLANRRAFERRQAVVCRDVDDAVASLRRLHRTGGSDSATADGTEVPVAFLFPGQGAQYVDMARDLYRHEPLFAAELDRTARLFTGHLGADLRDLLFVPDDEPDAREAAARRLEQTAITQPVMFAVEYALARLWTAWGVRPAAMVGHSVGEYTAACLAGVFSLEDAVRLVAERGRLVQAMPAGAMLAVFLPERELTARLGDDLCVAAVNSTGLCVASGPAGAVDDLHRELTADGVACRRLRTSHAFHSPSMDDAVAPFVDLVRRVRLRAPQIPFCSNVTGTWITDREATSPEYWGAHLREAVRFGDALDVLLADPAMVMLEVGPGQSLGDFVRRHRAYDGRTVLGSLRHPKQRRDDRDHLRNGLGALWSTGVPVDWAAHYAGEDRRRVPLPGYAFQRQRYWIEAGTRQARAPGGRSSGVESSGAGFSGAGFSGVGWRRLPAPTEPAGQDDAAVWLVLGADLALGRELAERLEAEGRTVVRVSAGTGAEPRRDGGSWSLDPSRRDHHGALLRALTEVPAEREPKSVHIVHLWSLGHDPLDGPDAARPDPARFAAARALGFDGLLALAQGIDDARPAVPIAIDVLCRGVHSVTGEEALQPENATLLGLCTVIPQEVAGVTCRTLDVTGVDPRAPRQEAVLAVRTLLGRVAAADDDDEAVDEAVGELALRGRHWWVRGFDPARLGSGPARLRDGGVYLITGGLGGVGLALAEHIAGAVDGPVLGLLGRSSFPAQQQWVPWLDSHDEQDPTSVRIRRLRRLQELGATVRVLQADVTDLEQTVRAVRDLRTGFGALNGVVHAAGRPSVSMIAGKSREDADAVLAAKTRGTLVLDQALEQVLGRQEHPGECDFVLLCSSLTGLLGGPGQSDYAAANTFLDAYAEWKRQTTGAPFTSIGWDTWRGVGMAADLAARFGGDGGGPAGEPTGHPLLQRLVRRTDQARTYLTVLRTADSWILDDHRIMGHGLVPGTTYLELVRAAVAEQARGRIIELHDVLFLTPIIVPDGRRREIYTTVSAHEGGLRFTVRSLADTGTGPAWQEHASGLVSFHDADSEQARDAARVRDLDAIVRDLGATEVIETEEKIKRRFKLDLVEKGGRIEFAFGPRWRCLRRILVGDGRLLVTLALDEEFLPDLDDYGLHPALLDVAGASARIHARDVFYLPFTYRSLRVSAGLTGTVHCLVERRDAVDASGETLTCDFDILDPQGRSLVRITEFTIKRINDIDGLLGQIQRAVEQAEAEQDEAEQDGGAAGEDAVPGALRALGEGMSEADAVAAFARILTAPSLPAQLVVAHTDPASLRRLARSITPALLAREVERLVPIGGTHPRPDLDTPYVAAVTGPEEAVAGIWQEVLGIDRVGVHDDFFALGGHSLAAVQIGAKIQSRFGTELNLRTFFDTPTVAGTVAALAAAGPAKDAAQEGIRARSRDLPEDGETTDLGAPDGLDGLDDIDGLSDEEVEARLHALLAAETKRQGDTA